MWQEVGKKIRQLRDALDESQAVFGERFGVEQATVSRWERGEVVARRYHEAIADLAGMSVAEFFHSKAVPRIIPIVGYVAGGDTFIPTDDHAPGAGVDYITLELGESDQVAVRVRGNSMKPAYRDGDVVIGSRVRGASIDRALGRDCIVKTTTGEGYLKIVKKGSKRNRFRLLSYDPDFEDIVDVELEWAAPVVWVARKP